MKIDCTIAIVAVGL